MDPGRRQYTFFWFIENYAYQNRKTCDSPSFIVSELLGTSWFLQLNQNEFGVISFSLCRSKGLGLPKCIEVHYELSVLGADGSPLSSMEHNQLFHKYDSTIPRFCKIDEAVLRRNADCSPQEILTVRCKISIGEGNVRNVGQCSARTRFRVEKVSFLQKVEQFSTLAPLLRHTVHIPSHSNMEDCISCSLYSTISSREDIMLEIISPSSRQILKKCEVYLLDAAGNATKCGGADFRYNTEVVRMRTFPLSVTRKEALRRKDKFLPDDKFSLLCKCTFYNGLDCNSIEETLHKMPLTVKQKMIDVLIGNPCNVAEISTYPSALDDMKALYLNQSHTDVQLKTKTKSFPAHSAVLCARSPVFSAMMSSNMKEQNTSCIDVDDLEEDVVQQLLLFLYSDSVENLEWKMAARLYYAADKYQVGKLKKVCSSFLLENLTPTNAGDLLFLADTHCDMDLKKLVEDFILRNEEAVFGSDDWEKMMETNPVLVMKTMHLKYKRRRLE